jgi:xanthine dehydrogenase molybdopterin-binding subunit B
LKTIVKYKVSVSFQGTAVVEMEAESPEAARIAASEMTIDDLARKSHSDISTLKVAAKEIIPISAISGQADAASEENAPRKPRPSGWYRPL